MGQKNKYRIAKWQHIIPKRVIENFANDSGDVTCLNTSTKRVTRKKPKAKDFCVNQVWDEGSEKGWMKEIEDSFSDTCKSANDGKTLSQRDHHRITDFYLLMYFRFLTVDDPLESMKMSPSTLEERKSGEIINTALVGTAMISGIPNREVKVNLFGFEPDKETHFCEVKRSERTQDRIKGNQNLNCSTFLTTPPTSKEHSEYLESNVTWGLGENKSVDAKSRNQREAVHYFDNDGVLSSKIVNGLHMQMQIMRLGQILDKLKWGYITTKCGEFLLSRNLPKSGILPISPTSAFVANYESAELTCHHVHEFNKIMLSYSTNIICKNENQIMIDKPICS